MEKFSLDKGWLFHLGDVDNNFHRTHTEFYMAAKAGGALGAASPDHPTADWQKVDLPHDWAVYGEFAEEYGPAQGYKPRGKGWYKRRFRLDESDKGKQLLIEFEGISGHAVVYCNGSVVKRNFCGYNSFTADITDMAVYGDILNDITVFVDADVIEGWWYEGAGIYRHVNLYKRPSAHIAHWGVFVHPEKLDIDVWDALCDTTVENTGYDDVSFTLISRIIDKDGHTVGKCETSGDCSHYSRVKVCQSLLTYSPLLWDIDSPQMYTMKSELYIGDVLSDTAETPFGFRTISISADDGFMLNGRRVQLFGTCNHQDHAGVGVAVPNRINEYRIRLLKEMGTNAYRCSHGNPSPYILELCDKYGLLVMDENRNFTTSPDGIDQINDMVLRDRNHPSVIMYSIFNEEPLQGTPTGRKLAEHLQAEIKSLDDTRPVLGAMNTGVLADDGAADVLDITGFNYITHTFDSFREKFPHMPMLGSENDSAFATRGVYKTDFDAHVIDNYDTEAAPWGNTYRDGFRQIMERPHIMGMFIWTGFDYRGEPTPFEWPSIGTQFGIMDTCGFKKDVFYLNKAFFTDEPMIHVLPHWNHSEGDTVKIMAYTNCTEAEIFVNDVSFGKKPVDKYDMVTWEIPFTPGFLKAVGTKGNDTVSDIRKTAAKPSRLIIEASDNRLFADCKDSAAINVYAVDKDGTFVPDCSELVRFSVTNGAVIGVGNGDPNSHEEDKADFRRLFNGCAQAIVCASSQGVMTVRAEAEGMEAAEISIEVIENKNKLPECEAVDLQYISKWRMLVQLSDTMPDPEMQILDHDMNTWGICTPGSLDEKFDGAVGFALYKTHIDIPEQAAAIAFDELTADKAYVYINGNLMFCDECTYGCKAVIPLDNVSGNAEISVILQSTVPEHKGGISKSVSLYTDRGDL